jgi:hypothetical protein
VVREEDEEHQEVVVVSEIGEDEVSSCRCALGVQISVSDHLPLLFS